MDDEQCQAIGDALYADVWECIRKAVSTDDGKGVPSGLLVAVLLRSVMGIKDRGLISPEEIQAIWERLSRSAMYVYNHPGNDSVN
jgi:hypothetical protein